MICRKVQEIVAQVHCCQQLGRGKKKKNSHNRNETEMVNTLTEKTHFLLTAEVVPFRSFGFVLLSY